jgi:hypothetical protein
MMHAAALFGFLQGALHGQPAPYLKPHCTKRHGIRAMSARRSDEMVPLSRSNTTKISEDPKTPIETACDACHDC